MISIKNTIKNIYINSLKDYHSTVAEECPWVFSSYIPEPFYKENNSKFMLKHQNRRESLVLRDVFNNQGFNYLSMRYDKKINYNNLITEKPNIIFGMGKNFVELSKEFSKAKKIYYATGSYPWHQNHMVKKRTDEVNIKKGSSIPYYRTVLEDDRINISDFIIQIGSKYTVETYPEEYRKKIYTIRQSSFEFLNLDIIEKKKCASIKNYLWFGSGGSILKGLDLVLEYFSKQKNLHLHVVGNVDYDFKKIYKNELFNNPNIKFYGYLPIDSQKLKDIAMNCSFILFPSGSEGGLPGSVINMMRLGLIPIVSKYAASDEIFQTGGLIIKELEQNQMAATIEASQKYSEKELFEFFQCNYEHSKNNYNLETYKKDMTNVLEDILNN